MVHGSSWIHDACIHLLKKIWTLQVQAPNKVSNTSISHRVCRSLSCIRRGLSRPVWLRGSGMSMSSTSMLIYVLMFHSDRCLDNPHPIYTTLMFICKKSCGCRGKGSMVDQKCNRTECINMHQPSMNYTIRERAKFIRLDLLLPIHTNLGMVSFQIYSDHLVR